MELRELTEWFLKNVNCNDEHFFPKDLAEMYADRLMQLLAPVVEKARLWDEVIKVVPARCVPDHEICGYSNCAGVCKKIRGIIAKKEARG